MAHATNPTKQSFSLICDISLGIASFLQKRSRLFKTPPYYLAIFMLAIVPLILNFPLLLRDDASKIGLSMGDKVIVWIWPFLLILLPSIFAIHASKQLLEISAILKRISGNCADDLFEQWKDSFDFKKQLLVAVLVGVAGTFTGVSVARALQLHEIVLILGGINIFISGFIGGLGFYMGAMSPALLIHVVKNCHLVLDPLDPANTIELQIISNEYSKIVMKGAIVGVFLSMPLLYFLSKYIEITIQGLFVISIMPAWFVLLGVFLTVQGWIYTAVRESRNATRRYIRNQIKAIYDNLESISDSDRNKLSYLVELDKNLSSARLVVVDLVAMLRTIFSVVITLAPLLIDFMF